MNHRLAILTAMASTLVRHRTSTPTHQEITLAIYDLGDLVPFSAADWSAIEAELLKTLVAS